LAIDRWFGEPPVRWHPVVWMGRYLNLFGPSLIRQQPETAFVRGAAAWLVGAAAVGLIAVGADRVLSELPLPLKVLGVGLLLKPMLSWQMLHDEVAAVESALATSVEAGRVQLQRLVSRDVSQLDVEQVSESALESLAENLNDSLVAPLFWFAVGGIGAAAVYRFANTADAMWGYRGRYEWAGKWAARADDVLSWLPARLTALLLCLAAGRTVAWSHLTEAARLTPSPNGGWPMGAMALLLGVRLSKPGVYALNPGGAAASPAQTGTALRWSQRAVWLAALVAAVLGSAIGFNPLDA
ncbi:MAG: adenosylcobinamide-phosphate synthase CbiB, partial [Burkholderiales bacterium]